MSNMKFHLPYAAMKFCLYEKKIQRKKREVDKGKRKRKRKKEKH